jgi:hypothetical protein
MMVRRAGHRSLDSAADRGVDEIDAPSVESFRNGPGCGRIAGSTINEKGAVGNRHCNSAWTVEYLAHFAGRREARYDDFGVPHSICRCLRDLAAMLRCERLGLLRSAVPDGELERVLCEVSGHRRANRAKPEKSDAHQRAPMT